MKKQDNSKKEGGLNRRYACSLLLIAFLIIIGFTYTACGVDPLPEKEEDYIVFWTTMGPPSYDYLKEIVNNYNATEPAIKVKLARVDDSSTNISCLLDAIKSGNAPDIYMLDRFTVAQRAAEGILQDLTPHLGKFNMHDYQDFATEETQFRKRTYAIPFDADVRGLYYNKAFIREVDISVLSSVPASPIDTETGLPMYNDLVEFMNWVNGPITHEHLKEIAKEIDKEENGSYTKVGFIPQMDQGNPYTWGYCFGGEFANNDGTQVTPDDPNVLAAFDFLYNWNNDMDIAKVQSFLDNYNYFNDLGDYATHPFVKEDVAMTINGDWFMDVLKEYSHIEYGVTYIPVPNAGGKSSTWAGGYAWGIPKGSNKAAEAIKFIAYGCGSNGQRIYCKKFNKAPTLYSLAIEDDFYAPAQPYFQEVLSSAKIRPPLPVGASYWDELCKAQDEVVVKGALPATALGEVKTVIQPMLNEILQR